MPCTSQVAPSTAGALSATADPGAKGDSGVKGTGKAGSAAVGKNDQKPNKRKSDDDAWENMSELKKRRRFRDACRPAPISGRLLVTEDMFEKYEMGGDAREDLFKVFVNAKGQKDP